MLPAGTIAPSPTDPSPPHPLHPSLTTPAALCPVCRVHVVAPIFARPRVLIYDMACQIVTPSDDILEGSPEGQRQAARDTLTALGVEILTRESPWHDIARHGERAPHQPKDSMRNEQARCIGASGANV